MNVSGSLAPHQNQPPFISWNGRQRTTTPASCNSFSPAAMMSSSFIQRSWVSLPGVRSCFRSTPWSREPAALGVGRVVEVGGNGDQSALPGVLDGHAVDGLVLQAALGEVGVVQADHRRPVARLLVDLLAQRQLGGRAAIGELPGEQPLVGPLGELFQVIEDGPSLGVGLRVGGFQGKGRCSSGRQQQGEGVTKIAHLYSFSSNRAGRPARPRVGCIANTAGPGRRGSWPATRMPRLHVPARAITIRAPAARSCRASARPPRRPSPGRR